MTENEVIEELHRIRPYVEIIPQRAEALGMAIKALGEIQQYREIGTVEECRAAVEKQKPKKPTEQYKLGTSGRGGKCPSCKHYLDRDIYAMYCDCGQRLDWSSEE